MSPQDSESISILVHHPTPHTSPVPSPSRSTFCAHSESTCDSVEPDLCMMLTLPATFPGSDLNGGGTANGAGPLPPQPPNDAHTTAAILQGHSSGVTALAYSHNSKLVATSGPNDIILWDVSEKTILHQWKAHDDKVYALAFSHDDKRLASRSEKLKVKVWSVETGTKLATLDQNELNPNADGSVAWSTDGRWIASSSQDAVHLWDAETYEEKPPLEHNGVRFVGFSHNSRWLVSCGEDNCARIWDVAQGVQYRMLSAPGDKVKGDCAMVHADFDAEDRRLVACSSDHTMSVWNIQAGDESANGAESMEGAESVLTGKNIPYQDSAKLLNRIQEGRCWISRVAFSNDGTSILTVLRPDKGAIKIRDAPALQILLNFDDRNRYRESASESASACFSPDSQYIASWYDRTIHLRHVDKQAILKMFDEHKPRMAQLKYVVFSPDGTTLTSGDSKGNVCIRLAHEWTPGPDPANEE